MEVVIIPLIIALILFYAIAELFGRAKHIGRGWTFLLLVGGVIPGLIALIASPSTKNEPTKGTIYHSVAGWISLILLGIIGLIPSFFSGNPMTAGIALSFVFTGIYLINLGKGKIVNANPKYYFANVSAVSFNNEKQSERQDNSIHDKKPIIVEYKEHKPKSKSLDEQKKLLLEVKNDGILTVEEYNSKLKTIIEQEAAINTQIEEERRQELIRIQIEPQLKKLNDLKDANLLTEDEFDMKKTILLNEVTTDVNKLIEAVALKSINVIGRWGLTKRELQIASELEQSLDNDEFILKCISQNIIGKYPLNEINDIVSNKEDNDYFLININIDF